MAENAKMGKFSAMRGINRVATKPTFATHVCVCATRQARSGSGKTRWTAEKEDAGLGNGKN